MAPEDPAAEYESDPEELNRSLTTRRREASDDEDDDHNLLANDHIDSDDEQSAILDSGEGDDEADFSQLEFIPDDDNTLVAANGTEDSATDLVDDAQEGQKKKEPFAVPTAGAFYMHDDRFQELDAASNRRMRGGSRLWQSRDERKWGHDKYDEVNTQEKQYDRRTSRGRVRGRGQDRGYSRASNSKVFTGNGHQNQFPKAVTRGRGPRRYEVALRNGNQAPSVQTKQSQNSFVKVSHTSSGHPPTETASLETEAIQAKKNVLASNLNSASPPFYPSGSSQKDLQTGIDRLHINQNPTPSGKKFGNTKSSSSWVRTAQPSQTTSHSRDAPPPGQMLYQQSPNQGDKVSSLMHIRGMPKGTVQSCTQPPGQAFDQNSAVNSLPPSPPPKTGLSNNQYISGEIESAAETGALVAKGKGSLKPSGGGSFMYGGTQLMGPARSMTAGHGNSNFPAFLPVMQFGVQHGGVPTFGMALPGYVQPEHGTGNPEMTWLPILPGPGALGGSYCPPYAAIDGSYQAHKPMLPSSAGSSSQENTCNNPNDEEPMDRPEVANNGNSQRWNGNPNKQPRRYSEMSFSK